MDLESIAGIRHGLQDSRRDGLTEFFHEFMLVLLSEGYSFVRVACRRQDLLHAIANWASEQPRLDEVVGHLEKAKDEIHSTN